MNCSLKITKPVNPAIFLVVAVGVFLLNQLPCLQDMRPIFNDEAWYGNPAYNLINGNGLINTVVGSGGNENCLFPLIAALFFFLFGPSVLSIRLASVFCGVVTLVLIHLVLNETGTSSKGRIAALLSFVSLPMINTVFRMGRPESAALMCLTGGVLFYLKYCRTRSWRDILGLDLFCFLAINAHPFTALIFFLMGVVLLGDVIYKKSRGDLPKLLTLVLSAVMAFGLIALMYRLYNPSHQPSQMLERVSTEGWATAVKLYFNRLFVSRKVVNTILVIPVIVLASFLVHEQRIRHLAWVSLIYMVCFPLVFSTDFAMISIACLDYPVLLSVLLIGPLVDALPQIWAGWASMRKWVSSVFFVYCAACMALNAIYNYGMEYEKCNSVLVKEIDSVIPPGSSVFGPLKQWYFAKDTRYYSEFYRLELPEKFDYIISDSKSDKFWLFPSVMSKIKDYELVYSKKTRQYGEIAVYKRKIEKN